jgi:hypothetical protein
MAIRRSLIATLILSVCISLISRSPVCAQEFHPAQASKSTSALKITPAHLSFGRVTVPQTRSVMIAAQGNTSVAGNVGSPSSSRVSHYLREAEEFGYPT